MKTNTPVQPGTANKVKQKTWQSLPTLTLFMGLLFASTSSVVVAQGPSDKAETTLSRSQIKMERDEFLKTHRWDDSTSNWVLKSGSEPPAGMKTRAEIKAEREEFLRNNRYIPGSDSWEPVKTQPRNMETMSRAQVRNETRQFLRTHSWDDAAGSWVAKPSLKKSK